MSKNKFDPKETGGKFIAYLRSLRQDRGAMARLRGALKPAQRHRAWPLLAPVGGIGHPVFETLAGLYARHPDEAQSGNLGTTSRQLSVRFNSFDGRFRRLLACDREEICDRLAPVIAAAKAQGVPVNYEELFSDLCYWGDRVKERWAREYWGVTQTDEASAATAEAVP